MADRIDWQKIRAFYEDEDTILILNARVAGILSSIWHRFNYEATFREADYDYADWDYLQRILADGESNVGNPMKLSDLVQYIDGVEALLTTISQLSHDNCCSLYERIDFSGGQQFTDIVEDGVGDVPQNIIDAGFASGTTDWAGYDDYKCLVAHLVVLDGILKLRKMAELFDSVGGFSIGAGAIAGIVAMIWAAPAGVLLAAATLMGSFVTVSQIWEAIGALGEDGVNGLADDMEAAEEALACAIYKSDGTEDAIAQYEQVLQDTLGTVLGSLAMSLFATDSIRALLGGRYDDQDVAAKLAQFGYTGQEYDCSSCLDPLGEDELDAYWSFETQTVEGWAL